MALTVFDEEPGADSASVLPFEWAWQLYEPIRPCGHCSDWYAELIFKQPREAIWVREWHAQDCPIWTELRAVDAEAR
jgi:hypothetical protein